MSVTLAAILIITGLVGLAAVAIGLPLVVGAMIYDIARSPKAAPRERASAGARVAAERGVARAFVILGGAFWSIAAFAGLYSFQQTGWAAALLGAGIPLVAVAVTLIVGWYYERFASAMLFAASIAVVAWGVVYQFELGVWFMMTFALIGPMMTAAVLFWMARREQEVFERVTAGKLELSPVFAARSSLG